MTCGNVLAALAGPLLALALLIGYSTASADGYQKWDPSTATYIGKGEDVCKWRFLKSPVVREVTALYEMRTRLAAKPKPTDMTKRLIRRLDGILSHYEGGHIDCEPRVPRWLRRARERRTNEW